MTYREQVLLNQPAFGSAAAAFTQLSVRNDKELGFRGVPWVAIGAIASVVGAATKVLSYLDEKDDGKYLSGIHQTLQEMQASIGEIKSNVSKILELVMQFEDLLDAQDRRNASRDLVALIEQGIEKLPGWLKETVATGKPNIAFQFYQLQLELAIKKSDEFFEDSANVALAIAINATIMRVLGQIKFHPQTLINHVQYLTTAFERLAKLAQDYSVEGAKLENQFDSAEQFLGAEYLKNKDILDSHNRFQYMRSTIKAANKVDAQITESNGYLDLLPTPIPLVVEKEEAIGSFFPYSKENEIDVFPEEWWPENRFLDREHTEAKLLGQLEPILQEYLLFKRNMQAIYAQAFALTIIKQALLAQL